MCHHLGLPGGIQMIAEAGRHCGDRMNDLVYRLFGGKRYQEGEAAIAGYQKHVESIYAKVREI
jgi:hypothetical protein